MHYGLTRTGWSFPAGARPTKKDRCPAGCPERKIELGEKEITVFCAKQPIRLAVTHGSVWVTLENDPHDFVLHAGEKLTVHHPGKVVVQSMNGQAQVVLEPNV